MNLLDIPEGEEAKVEPEAILKESLGQFKALAKKGTIVSTKHQKIKSLKNSLLEGVYDVMCPKKREDARGRREEVREPQEAR